MSSLFVAKTLVMSLDGISPNTVGNTVPYPPGLPFDGTTNVTVSCFSVPIFLFNKDSLGLQFSCSSQGTPNGSFSMQCSNDSAANESAMVPDGNLKNWSTIAFWDESSGIWVTSKAVSGAQSFMASVQVLTPRWWRLVWTNTSGTINPIAKLAIKADGGR